MEATDIYRKMTSLMEQGVPFVLATVVEALGSTPRKAGSKMIVLPDGSTVDTIGGGKIEQQIITDALETLKRGISRMVEYELRPTGEHALGMACGGETKVFLEVNLPVKTLLIIGAGHIAQKLMPMAKLLDFRVVIVDSREDFASQDRLPEADEVVWHHPGETAQVVNITPTTAIVIVTHGHIHDQDALRSVIGSPAWYIGMIGSRQKVRTVLDDLRAEGVADELLAKVHAPIGLNIGGQTPAEISVSILAEIIAEQYGKAAKFRPAETGEVKVAE